LHGKCVRLTTSDITMIHSRRI